MDQYCFSINWNIIN